MTRLSPLHAAALPLALVALAAFGCAPPAEEAPEEEVAIEEEMPVEPETMEATTATATLMNADGTEVGTATFTQENGQVTAAFHLTGTSATPGMHGIHVHETGECTPPDFTSAGGHFNPTGVDHACPPTAPRHAGDFGNVEIAEDGSGHLEVTTDLVSVDDGPNSVVGKAVILHAGQDDCSSQPTGDAGGRLACGVIEGGGMNGMGHEDHDDMEDGEVPPDM
jgi:Cu-Zn family superoxide dismutase